jgi:Holliday junction DNA helicase RuvA
MIGKLKGMIDAVEDDHLVIDVGGVGYIAFCSSKTLNAAGRLGEAAMLYIETHVREDHIHLYGFASPAERSWFKTLTNVQGVGAKVALALLSVFTPLELTQAIAAQDKTFLTKAAGVGPKLAARLVTELKDKVGSFIAEPQQLKNLKGKKTGDKHDDIKLDAISALTNLGIARMDAFLAVNKVANDDKKLEQVITEALKEVGR